MAQTKTFNIQIDSSMNVSKITKALSEVQQKLSGLKLPQTLNNDIKNTIKSLTDEIDEFQRQSTKGLTSMQDVKKITSSYEKIANSYKKLNEYINKIDNKNLKELIPDSALKNINKASDALKEYSADIQKTSKDVDKLNKNIEKFQNNKVDVSNKKGQLSDKNKLLGSQKGNYTKQINSKNKELEDLLKQQERITKGSAEYNILTERIRRTRKEIDNLENSFKSTDDAIKKNSATIKGYETEITQIEEKISKTKNEIEQLETSTDAFDKLRQKIAEIKNVDISEIPQDFNKLKTIIDNLTSDELTKIKTQVEDIKKSSNEAAPAMKKMGDSISSAGDQAEKMSKVSREISSLKSQVEYFFGVQNAFHLLRRAINQAYESVKELDKAMTETAVVTDFSVGDMWEALPKYTAAANELGTTTLGAYETMTLYYQQGLDTNEVFEIGTETMKMARIAGMDYTKATDLMTAALRGFNMELSELSARRINDVYSELAAITAADTEEIADAMTRTASIADSAGMEFETTSAFLSHMIETTREAPENLGTAMKTIIARFQELKKSPLEIAEVDGEEVSLNKIDTALKSIGVSLTDTTGQFRELDDVFLEISSKWDGLDKNTQRYIATIAAGSRQQSRFIAMMSNYDRTMELVDAANNSAGASQKQFEKTTESLESKINKLKNAWNEFTMGIANSKAIKLAVDALTKLFDIVNKITGVFGEGAGTFLKLGAAFLIFKGGQKILDSFFRSIGKGIGKGFSDSLDGVNFSGVGAKAGNKFSEGFKKGTKNTKAADAIIRDIEIAFKKSNGNMSKISLAKSFIASFKKATKEVRQQLLQSDIMSPFIMEVKEELSQIPEIGENIAKEFVREFCEELENGKIGSALKQLKEKVENQTGQNYAIASKFKNSIGGQLENRGKTFTEKTAYKTNKAGYAMSEISDLAYLFGFNKSADIFMQLGIGLSSFGELTELVAPKIAKIKESLLGLKEANEVTGAFSKLGLSMGKLVGGGLALGAAIAVITYAWNKHKEVVKENREAFENAGKDYKKTISDIDSNISKIEQYKSEFAKLSKGVNENGENIGLSADEYKRYNEIVNDLVAINPSLVKGYNDQGQALVNNNDIIKESIKLQEELKKAETEKYLNKGEKIYKGYNDKLAETQEQIIGILKEGDVYSDSRGLQIGITGTLKEAIEKVNEESDLNLSTNVDINSIDEIVRNKDQLIDATKRLLDEELKEGEISQEEYDKKLNSQKELLANLEIEAETRKTNLQEIKNYLLTYASAAKDLGGAGLGKLIDSEIYEGYEKGIELIASSGGTIDEQKTKVEDFTREIYRLSNTFGDSGIGDELRDIKKAQDELANSDYNEEARNDYIENIKKETDELETLAETYENTSPVVAAALRSMAKEYENFAQTFSLEEALDITNVNLESARGQYEAWQEATKEDFDTAIEGYKKIYDDLTSDDANDFEGRGSIKFWDAATRFLSDDVILDAAGNVDIIKNKLRELSNSGALNGGYETTDWLFNELGEAIVKDKEALEDLGVTMKEGKYFLDVDPKHYQELANTLGISRDLLVSMLDNARQFGNISFEDPLRVAEALKESEDKLYQKGKTTYYSLQLFKEQAKAAGKTEAEINSVLANLPEEGVELINLSNAQEALDYIKEIQKLNEKGGQTGKGNIIDIPALIENFVASGASELDIIAAIDKALSQGYQMGYTGDKGKKIDNSYLNKDGELDETKISGIIQEIQAGYELANVDPLLESSNEQTEGINSIDSSVKAILAKMGVTPELNLTKYRKQEEKNQKAWDSGKGIDEQITNSEKTRKDMLNKRDELEKLKSIAEKNHQTEAAEKYNEQLQDLHDQYAKLSRQEFQMKMRVNFKVNGESSGVLYDYLANQGYKPKEIQQKIELISEANPETKNILTGLIEKGDFKTVDMVFKILEEGFSIKDLKDNLLILENKDGETFTVDLEAEDGVSPIIQKVEKEGQIFEYNPITGTIIVKDKAGEKIKEIQKGADNYEDTYTGIFKEEGIASISTKLGNLLISTSSWVGSHVATFIQKFKTENEEGPIKRAEGTKGRRRPHNYKTAYRGKDFGEEAGPALTGELGPELVWSNDHAYMVGEQGPEVVDLKKGDVVYSHEDTKKILKGKSVHNTIPSHAYTSEGYTPGGGNPSKGTGSGSKGNKNDTQKDNTKETKKNTDSTNKNTKKLNQVTEPLDKLYNTLQYIDKELRMVNKYQERYERLLETTNVTGQDLIKNLKKQADYYNKIIKRSSYGKKGRQQEIKTLLNTKPKWEYEARVKNKDGKYEEQTKKKKAKKELDYWLNYNKKTNTVTVNQKRLNKLKNSKVGSDRALYNHIIKEILPKLEGFQDDIEKFNDDIEDSKNALQDIKKIGQEAFRTIEDRVLDAIIHREQEKIDKLSQINDSVNDANQDMITAIQNNLSKIREERDNKKTEDDIASKERRLAYLRRDTSNANALEIKQLEKELAEQKEDYTDTLIDQKISELQEQNDAAANQRQQQIELLQSQLDWDSKNGVFWEEAHKLIKEGFDEATGQLIATSEMVQLLQNAEGWAGFSEEARNEWFQDLTSLVSEMYVWLKNNSNSALGTGTTLKNEFEQGNVHAGDKFELNKDTGLNQISGSINKQGDYVFNGKKGDDIYFKYDKDRVQKRDDGTWWTDMTMEEARRFNSKYGKTKVWMKKNGMTAKDGEKALTKVDAAPGADGFLHKGANGTGDIIHPLHLSKKNEWYSDAAYKMITSAPDKFKKIKFKKGGLADFTGPAWLDGTKSKPELVLNQRDTENFIQLKDILKSILTDNIPNNSNNSGDNYYEIDINVEKLENDYDVKQVAEKVKRIIHADAKYRNVNAINRLR